MSGDNNFPKDFLKGHQIDPKILKLAKENIRPIVTPNLSVYREMQRTQNLLDEIQHQKKLEKERDRQELLEAIKSSKSVRIENKFENSPIGNFQQMVDSNNSVQNVTSQEIDYPRLVSTLKELFEHLPDEEKKEAQDALDEFKNSVEANEKPSKTVLRCLKRLANGAIEKAGATMIATGLLDGGQWIIQMLDALIKAHT